MAGKRPTSNGRCSLCGAVFSKAAMSAHLKSCRKKTGSAQATEKPAKRRAFHLVVEGRYQPEYWMHLEVPAEAALDTLDRFLRDIWLECCGHLSEFEIQGVRYSAEPVDFMPVLMGEEEGSDETGMEVRLKDVLTPGMKFEHAYDFGSTTHLRLRVVSEGASSLKPNEIKVLARNEPPVIPCVVCGKPATQVCTQCLYSGSGWLCEECAARHDCEDPMFLPVVNSPRVGVCGYTG
jgi:hypothetical protein